jgi:hypothetical protein
VRLQRAAREAEERSLAARAPAKRLTRRGATNLTAAVNTLWERPSSPVSWESARKRELLSKRR